MNGSSWRRPKQVAEMPCFTCGEQTEHVLQGLPIKLWVCQMCKTKQKRGVCIMSKMTSQEYLEFVEDTMDEMFELIKSKNKDYTNGAGPFANFDQSEDFGVDPFTGLMIRMGDKFQRVKSYCKQGELTVPGEGIEDAAKDIIGYALLALGMLHERKR